MKERSICFNTEMVRAILEGRKTQTRRLMNGKFVFGSCITEKGEIINCPYGKIGYRLWVKETFTYITLGCAVAMCYKADGYQIGSNWKTSIHMPRWASRILLEITNIRVERVQDITEKEAMEEGHIFGCDSIEWFQDMWDSINEKRGYGWEKNPWVWVIEFKRVEVPK